MSKLKKAMSVFAACFMAVVLIFAVGCNCGETGHALESITLNTDDVKKEYYTGENFDDTGLKLTATYQDGTVDDTLTVTSAGVKVDYSKYNGKLYGRYPIIVSYTKDDVTKQASFDVNVTDVKLLINGSDAKTTYIVNDTVEGAPEQFSTEGFKVSLSVTNVEGNTITSLNSGSYTFTNNVNLKKVGTYQLTATHNYNGYTAKGTYPINVIEPRYGYEVTLKNNLNNVLTLGENNESASVQLSAEKQTVDLTGIDKFDFISVKQSDKYGVVPANAPEVTEGLDVKVYKNDEETPLTDLTACGGGVYQIWVTGTVDGKQCSAFAIIYVIDSLKSITLKTDDASVLTTQVRGFENTMRPTWKFTVTYNSGTTKVVSFGDAGLTVPEFSANAKEDSGKVTVTFTENTAAGVAEQVECEVNYTLTGARQIAPYVYFSANFITEEKGYKNVVYENGGLEIKLGNDFTSDANSKTVTMPEGIKSDDGADAVAVTKRLKGGKGKADATISFTVSQDFTIYIWGISGSSSDNTRAISVTGGTPAAVGEFAELTQPVDGSGNPTPRVAKFSGITTDTEFKFDFGKGINVYYIVIAFGAQA